jgi:hypothetical protein
MRFRPIQVMDAKVDLYGLNTPPPSQPTAVVEMDMRGRPDHPRDLVALMTIVVVGMLRAFRNEPGTLAPFGSVLAGACQDLLDTDAQGAASYRVAQSQGADDSWAAELNPDFEYGFRDTLPIVVDSPGEGKRVRFKTGVCLKGDPGIPFARITSRNGIVGAFGALAVLEHIARTAPYEETVRPMAAAVTRLLEYADEVVADFPRPLSFDEATFFYAVADSLAAADDPMTWSPTNGQ